ncbi:MAG: hypothetical protein P8Q14_05055 [Vicingaceae bacterium]|nr:hypothetical protein [Vicingaceae bacterium]
MKIIKRASILMIAVCALSVTGCGCKKDHNSLTHSSHDDHHGHSHAEVMTSLITSFEESTGVQPDVSYAFTDLDGNEAKVEYTFGYKLVEGHLKIDLHHSSFLYNT